MGQYGTGMLDRAWAGMGVYESWRGAQHPSYRADAERAEVSRAQMHIARRWAAAVSLWERVARQSEEDLVRHGCCSELCAVGPPRDQYTREEIWGRFIRR